MGLNHFLLSKSVILSIFFLVSVIFPSYTKYHITINTTEANNKSFFGWWESDFNYKNVFYLIGLIIFWFFYVLWDTYNITNLKLRIVHIRFNKKIQICIKLSINRFLFDWCMNSSILVSPISEYLAIYIFLDLELLYVYMLFFNVLTNFSATHYFLTMVRWLHNKICYYYLIPLLYNLTHPNSFGMI